MPVTKGGIGYPRSKGLYTQLKKDAALCRNRGGEALAGSWGNSNPNPHPQPYPYPYPYP